MADTLDLGNLRYKFYGGDTDATANEIAALADAQTAGVTYRDTIRSAVSRKSQAVTGASTTAIDFADGGVVDVTLTASIATLTVTNIPAAGQLVTFILRQPAAGSKTVAWTADFVFKEETAPTLTTTASKVDVVSFVSDGTVLRETSRIMAVATVLNGGALSFATTMRVGGTAGAMDIGAIFQVDSTTGGFLPPRMTGTQRDAISTPAAGLMIYNTTTGKLNFKGASGWEAVTSA